MLVKIFYHIDNFCKDFQKQFCKNLLSDGSGLRDRKSQLSMSEVMTICIYYHVSGYNKFKDYYEKDVCVHMKKDFHQLVSYNRFLELRQKIVFPLLIFAQLYATKHCSGISFIDSFSLEVSHIRRASSHKTFKALAAKGKTSVKWFYGFKLHVVINNLGEIIAFCITPGNVADCNQIILTKLTKKLFGKLFGDKGYIVNKNVFECLLSKGVRLITKLRKNMKNKLITPEDQYFLKKRGIIESVGSILKEQLLLEHSRHRSIFGFLCHIISTIIAYSFRESKPSIASSAMPAITC
jgi:hypothetical protein